MRKGVFSILWSAIILVSSVSYGADRAVIREEARLVVDGVEEQWRLEWKTPPVSVCGPEDEDWYTCPCSGFAFGEGGHLDLVRKRPGHGDERLPLTPLFGKAADLPLPGKAVLRKWDAQKSDDMKAAESPSFVSKVRSRPASKIMKLADYDHDGRATEFKLQTETLPCGKQMNVVVGISRENPRLHVFSSVKRPKDPLLLQGRHWDMLSEAKGSVKAVHWPCGDHGSGHELEYELKAADGRIYATEKTYECDESDFRRGRLTESKEF